MNINATSIAEKPRSASLYETKGHQQGLGYFHQMFLPTIDLDCRWFNAWTFKQSRLKIQHLEKNRSRQGSCREWFHCGCFEEGPQTLDELFQNMIAAGEVGGILDIILTRLATYLEKAEKLKRQIKGV